MRIRTTYCKETAAWLLLLAEGLFAYRAAWHGYFLAEDFVLASLDWGKYFGWAFYPGEPSFYRPLMSIPWILGHFLWGDQSHLYHRFFILLQVLGSYVIYRFALYYSGNWPTSIFTALYFQLLLPVTEAVNWVSVGSHTLMTTAAYFWALYLYDRLRRQRLDTNSSPPLTAYAGCLVMVLISLLSHEFALTWPAAAFLLAWAQPQTELGDEERERGFLQRIFKRGLRELRILSPMILLWVVFLAWRTYAVKGIGVYGASTHFRTGWILLTDFWIYIKYFLWPFSEGTALNWWFTWVFSQHPLVSLLAVIFLVVLAWPARCWQGITLIFLIPVLNIPSAHRAYLPAAGYAILIGALAHWILKRLSKTQNLMQRTGKVTLGMLLGAILVFQMRAVHLRNLQWLAAGKWGDQVLQQTLTLVPKPAAGDCFYYYGLPLFRGEISVFVWGLKEAVQNRYGDRSLTIQTISSPPVAERVRIGLDADLGKLSPTKTGHQHFLLYKELGTSSAFQILESNLEEFKRLAEIDSH